MPTEVLAWPLEQVPPGELELMEAGLENATQEARLEPERSEVEPELPEVEPELQEVEPELPELE